MARYISAQRNLDNVLGGLKAAHKAEKRFIPRRIAHAKSIGANVGLLAAHQAGGKVKTKIVKKLVDRTTGETKRKRNAGVDAMHYKRYHNIGEERIDEIYSILAKAGAKIAASAVGRTVAGASAGGARGAMRATSAGRALRSKKAGYILKKRGAIKKIKAVKTAASNSAVGKFATKKYGQMEMKSRAKNISRIRLRRTNPVQAAVRDTGRTIAKDVGVGVAGDTAVRTATHHIQKRQEANWAKQKQATNATRSPYQQRRESAQSVLAFLREDPVADRGAEGKKLVLASPGHSMASAHVARMRMPAAKPNTNPSGGMYKLPNKTKTNTKVGECVSARAAVIHESVMGALTVATLAKPALKAATFHIRAAKKIGKKIGEPIAKGIKSLKEN